MYTFSNEKIVQMNVIKRDIAYNGTGIHRVSYKLTKLTYCRCPAMSYDSRLLTMTTGKTTI